MANAIFTDRDDRYEQIVRLYRRYENLIWQPDRSKRVRSKIEQLVFQIKVALGYAGHLAVCEDGLDLHFFLRRLAMDSSLKDYQRGEIITLAFGRDTNVGNFEE